jgi:hypothetical protein
MPAFSWLANDAAGHMSSVLRNTFLINDVCEIASFQSTNMQVSTLHLATDSLPVNYFENHLRKKNEHHHLCRRLCRRCWLRAEAARIVLIRGRRAGRCPRQRRQRMQEPLNIDLR